MFISLALCGACGTGVEACLEAPVVDTADAQGVISGTVVYDGPTPEVVDGRPAAGNVLIFVYRASAPPPPRGAGRPVTFAVVPRQALVGANTGGSGFHSAPFAIPLVPPGQYILTALLDVDGDFDPFALIRASATRGDVGGGFVDTSSVPPQFQVVDVVGGVVAQGVTLTLSTSQALFAADAPAVSLPPDASLSPAATLPTRFRLTALQRSPDGPAAAQEDLAGAGLPGVAVEFGDVDSDGVADDAHGDGFADVYPQVLLRRLADADPTDLTDAEGAVTIPCVVDPTSLLAGAWPPPSSLAPALGMFVQALDILCLPLAVDASVSPPLPLPRIPPGRYGLLLISRQGQVWRVPNELGPQADPVRRHLAAAPLPSQGAVVTVPDDPIAAGAVTGTLTAQDSPRGPTFVFVWRAADPPPPAGTGRPVASIRVDAATYTATQGVFIAPYTVWGLPPGTYLVGALLDQDRNFDARVERFSQASQGDWLGQAAAPTAVDTSAVTVDLPLAAPVTADPPLFDPGAASPMTLTGGVAHLRLDALSATSPLALREAGSFAVQYRATAGAPADQDGDGLLDVWPRALLQRVEAAPNDPSGVAADRRVILAAALDPVPLGMALGNQAGGPAVNATAVALAVAPSAVDATDAANPVPLPGVPAGTYALMLLDRTGQFARPLPVNADLLPVAYVTAQEPFPAPAAPLQDGLTVVVPALAPPSGGMTGTVTVTGAAPSGLVWVFVFDVDNPGPPDGAGLPVGLTRISPAAFVDVGGAYVAAFEVNGLPPGSYRVAALMDADRNFSLLSTLRSSATAGDGVGVAVSGNPARPAVVDVGTQRVTSVEVVVAQTVPVGPPAFEWTRAPGPLDAPQVLELHALTNASPAVSAGGPVDLPETGRGFAITLRDADGDGMPDDADGDGIPDLYPRVVLQPMDGAAVRVPALPDPSRYLPALLAGAPAVLADTLNLVVLPVALDAQGQAGPVSAGPYSVSALSVLGQVWTVPNELSPQAALAGGGVLTQGAAVVLDAGPTRGTLALSGSVVAPGGICGPLVVLARNASTSAFSALQRPAALSVVPPARGGTGACQAVASAYQLSGLHPGTYLVQAFVDVDGDFQPFVGTRAGPSAGDVGGGHLDNAATALEPVTLTDTSRTDVNLTLGQVAPLEKPAFRFDNAAAAGGPLLGGAVRTALVTTAPAGGIHTPLADVAAAQNAFATLSIPGPGGTTVWPLVLLVRLDETDPRGLAFRQPLEVVAGAVDDGLFTGSAATRIEVVFPPVRVDAALQPLAPANPGRYAVVVVNADGLRWQVPNELGPSLSVTGAGLAGSSGQDAVWTWQ